MIAAMALETVSTSRSLGGEQGVYKHASAACSWTKEA